MRCRERALSRSFFNVREFMERHRGRSLQVQPPAEAGSPVANEVLTQPCNILFACPLEQGIASKIDDGASRPRDSVKRDKLTVARRVGALDVQNDW
jgi:hypothetical protein